MNTYQITYFPPGTSTAGVSVAIQADSYAFDNEFALFTQTSNPDEAVFVVPLRLDPVIQRITAAA